MGTMLQGGVSWTMYQLKNLIKRTNVPKDPQDNMNAAEDFLLLLPHTHVVAAADTIMEFNRQTTVSELARLIIANYVHAMATYRQLPYY